MKENRSPGEEYIYISYRPPENYMAVRVHHDEMRNVGIFNKSIIICRKQNTAANNEIIIALFNGNQTVRRYCIHGEQVYLIAENSKYPPTPVTQKDELLILGKVVQVITTYEK